MTVGVVLCALAVLAFLSWGQYARRTVASGVLVPDRGLIKLVSSVSGTVVRRHVAEGQNVAEGEVLFELALAQTLLDAKDDASVRSSLTERQRSLSAALQGQQQLTASRREAWGRRLRALDAELAQLDAESALQRSRLELAQQSLQRLKSLQDSQFVSAAQVQAKSEEVLGVQAIVQGLGRQRASLLRDREELEGEVRALPLSAKASAGMVERELAQLSRETAEYQAERHLLVRAPQSGVVTAVLAEPGQGVSPTSTLATLVPQGSVWVAQLYVPSSSIGFIVPGQSVRLRFDAFPFAKFGQQAAHVVGVSRSPLAAGELGALSLPAVTTGAEPMFRITVALDAPDLGLPLAPGMRLQADILMERRRLVEWMFEPLLNLRARL
jgi:membrane fusion protein